MRSIPVVMTCCGLLVAACTYIPTTGLSVRGPATMSVHAKAELQVGAASDGGVPRPTRFRRLLVPPECDVEIDDEGPTVDPGIRVSARVPGPCAFALELDDGGERPRRVDLTIRFRDVPTLRPIEGAHWLDDCPTAVRAERFGDSVACEADGEVVVREAGGVSRIPGELKATDGAGGWWVCTSEACRVRGSDGEFRVVPGIATNETSVLPLRDPVGTFLVSRIDTTPFAAELVDRHTGAVTPIRDRPPGLWGIYVAGGTLFGTGFNDAGVEVAWGFVDDAWVEWETSAIVVDESFGMEEPLTSTRSRTVAVLRVEEGSRVVPVPLDVGWQELSSAARGIPGSRLFLLRRTAAIEVVRLTHEGLETVALAPWTVTNGSRRSGPVLVTNDAVVFPAQAVGGAPARFKISR